MIIGILCGCIGALLALVIVIGIKCRRLRKNIEAVKDQLALITDHFQALVGYVNTEHRYLYVNQRYAEWYGFSKEEMIGKTMRETLAPEAYARAHPVHEAVLRGERISFENVAPGPDGKQHHLWVDLVPHFDAAGGVKGFLGLLIDVSELKQKEEELRSAKEKAELANHAKSVFLANMSHELRTPLNGVLGYAQILQRDKSLTAEQRSSLAIIERSGYYLLDLINDILDLAKVEAGKIELSVTDANLLDLLQGISDMTRLKTNAKNIAFRLEAAPTLPHVIRADERRLRQVLLNLLGNAVKFTERGGVTLRVSALPVLQEEAEGEIMRLRFEVEDTGIGLTEADLKHLFEPFTQVGEARYKTQGTGLGLTISRNLARLMGGELRVASEFGVGSRFWFEISAPVVASASAAPQETQRVIGIEGASPRVLVVDDDQLNRRVIVDALAPLGFDMREARDGREGWRVALEWRPQAMIIDLRMPEMDGLTLIRQIRQDPALNEVVVIASSASVYQEDQQQSIVAGAQAFLPKPVSISLLLRQLQRGLRLTWRRAADVEVEPNAPASPRAVVNLERLAALPDALRKRLEEVAIVADMCGARSVIEEIRAIDAELADALAAFEQNFEYGKILELAQNAKA